MFLPPPDLLRFWSTEGGAGVARIKQAAGVGLGSAGRSAGSASERKSI